MKQQTAIAGQEKIPLSILLADDDIDDRFFFNKILKKLSILSQLTTVENGEELMTYLMNHSRELPDVLFLDLNMPRKNGSECLSAIKEDETLKHLPVIIYSTHLHEEDSDIFYDMGAHYYIRKTDMIELARILHFILNELVKNKFARPPKDQFIHFDQSFRLAK